MVAILMIKGLLQSINKLFKLKSDKPSVITDLLVNNGV